MKRRSIHDRKYIRSAELAFKDFAQRTSIHGIAYTESSWKLERWVWVVVVAVCMAFAGFLVLAFWERFSSQPTRVSLKSYTIPASLFRFPAVTICNFNHISPSNLVKVVRQLDRPPGLYIDDEVIVELLYEMAATSGKPRNQTNMNIIESILQYNRYTHISIMNSLGQSCEDMMHRCLWEGTEVNCSKIFFRTISFYGPCCGFNLRTTPISNDKPVRTDYVGVEMGLTVSIKYDEDNSSGAQHYSESVRMLIHHRNSYPSDTSVLKILPVGTETFNRVTMTHLRGENIRKMAIKKRDCVFPEEQKLKYFDDYVTFNCLVECKMLRYLDTCGCVPYYLPTTNEKEICNATRLPCVAEVYDEVMNSLTSEHNIYVTRECDCPEECTESYYETSTAYGDLNALNFSILPFYRDLNKSFAVFHVFYGSQVATLFEKSFQTSWIDLTASLGGIFSLCLGASFLSLFEVIYFFTIRMYMKYKQLGMNREINVNPKDEKNVYRE